MLVTKKIMPQYISFYQREKWRQENELKSRELDIRKAELQHAIHLSQKSTWKNPLVIAIVAATIAAIGNAGVAYYNSQHERALETAKAEQARLLEMLKAEDPDKVAENLQFLLDVGLVRDEGLVASIEKFLNNRNKGTGPQIAVSPFDHGMHIAGIINGLPFDRKRIGLARFERNGDVISRCTGTNIITNNYIISSHCVPDQDLNGLQFIWDAGIGGGFSTPWEELKVEILEDIVIVTRPALSLDSNEKDIEQ